MNKEDSVPVIDTFRKKHPGALEKVAGKGAVTLYRIIQDKLPS